MTEERAARLFEELLGSASLNFDRLQGGCEYRAEVMCRMCRQAGVPVWKAWAFRQVREDGNLGTPLIPHRQADPATTTKFFTWEFHVSAAVIVDADASSAFAVLDPSLSSGPCTASEWLAMMDARNARVLISDASVFLIDHKTLAFHDSPGDQLVDAEMAAQAGGIDTFVPRRRPQDYRHG